MCAAVGLGICAERDRLAALSGVLGAYRREGAHVLARRCYPRWPGESGEMLTKCTFASVG